MVSILVLCVRQIIEAIQQFYYHSPWALGIIFQRWPRHSQNWLMLQASHLMLLHNSMHTGLIWGLNTSEVTHFILIVLKILKSTHCLPNTGLILEMGEKQAWPFSKPPLPSLFLFITNCFSLLVSFKSLYALLSLSLFFI